MKKLILSTATQIAKEEGFNKISVRKIANRIEYSPSIIYHYYKDKEEIINHLMENGYSRILSAITLKNSQSKSEYCDSGYEKLKIISRNYINAALSMSDEFISVQLNKNQKIRSFTAFLYKGASNEKKALAELCSCLQQIFDEKNKSVTPEERELTAQIIATSSFGLILKLIIEDDIKEEQKDRLLNYFVNHTVPGIVNNILNEEG